MRKLLLSAVAFLALCSSSLAQGIGAPNPILCNQATNGSAAVQLAASIAGRNIVVCGWDVNAGSTTGAFTLSFGTGATCGAGTTTIVAWSNMVAGQIGVDHQNYAFYSVPNVAGVQQNFCVTTATNVTFNIYWGQY
jgi:hypothetical protein